MPTALRVSRGVAIGRTVTAQRHATGLTGAQVDPAVTGLDAFLTLMALRLFDSLYGVDMSTE
jgi:hypothetical protein